MISGSVLNEDDSAAMVTRHDARVQELVHVSWTRAPSMEVGAGAGAHWYGVYR